MKRVALLVWLLLCMLVSGMPAYSGCSKVCVGSSGGTGVYIPGSTSLTTLGTVTIGTWNGSPITDEYISSHLTWSSKEPGLGNPSTTGQVLSSTTGGVRSWIDVISSTGASTITTLGTITTGTWNGTPIQPGYIGLSFTNSLYSSAGVVSLVNDVGSPGATMLYGTNASGVKGWYSQPSGGSGGDMVYPGSGIPVSAGSAWGTSLTASDGKFPIGASGWTVSSFALSGTSGKTYTFPSASKTLAASDGSNLNVGYDAGVLWNNEGVTTSNTDFTYYKTTSTMQTPNALILYDLTFQDALYDSGSKITFYSQQTGGSSTNLIYTLPYNVPSGTGMMGGYGGTSTSVVMEWLPLPHARGSVRAATTANIALTNNVSLTIDGVALVSGDRILVKNQSTSSQNGIYTVQLGAGESFSRSADGNASELAGASVVVREGSTLAGTMWICSSSGYSWSSVGGSASLTNITFSETATTFPNTNWSDIIFGSALSSTFPAYYTINPGTLTMASSSTTIDSILAIHGTLTGPNNLNSAGLDLRVYMNPTTPVTGGGTATYGISSWLSSSVPSGYVLDWMNSLYAGIITGSGSGTVARGVGLYIDTPVKGTTGLTSAFAVYVENQGVSGITNAYGLFVNEMTGASGKNLSAWFGGLVGFGGQVVVGSDTATSTSAALEVISTTKAFLPPRMTTTQKTAITAIAGMQVFDSSTGYMQYYNGSSWTNMSGASVSPGGSDTYVQYNSSGSFSGSSKMTFNSSTGRLTLTNNLGVNAIYMNNNASLYAYTTGGVATSMLYLDTNNYAGVGSSVTTRLYLGSSLPAGGLYINADGSAKQVTVGSSDSCGTGYKCLRVPN